MPNTREKLIELLRDVQYLGGLEEKIADHLIANGVTILVRCKDCKYWVEEFCDNPNGLDIGANATAFCSYGERREGE